MLSLSATSESASRDLHDTVIQRLFAVGLSLQATVARAGDNPVLERIHQAIDDIDQTIRDLRSTIFALHARRAGTAGVRDDVIAIAHEAARALGFEPAVAFDGPVDSAATDSMHEHLIATLREALSNVARHAHANRAEVAVTFRQGHLVLRVGDDGVGIGDRPVSGNGLANMRQRAERLGGTCEVSSPHTLAARSWNGVSRSTSARTRADGRSSRAAASILPLVG